VKMVGHDHKIMNSHSSGSHLAANNIDQQARHPLRLK